MHVGDNIYPSFGFVPKSHSLHGHAWLSALLRSSYDIGMGPKRILYLETGGKEETRSNSYSSREQKKYTAVSGWDCPSFTFLGESQRSQQAFKSPVTYLSRWPMGKQTRRFGFPREIKACDAFPCFSLPFGSVTSGDFTLKICLPKTFFGFFLL